MGAGASAGDGATTFVDFETFVRLRVLYEGVRHKRNDEVFAFLNEKFQRGGGSFDEHQMAAIRNTFAKFGNGHVTRFIFQCFYSISDIRRE